MAARFTGDVARAADDLIEAGYGVSCLIVDTIFSSDGIFADPVLKGAVDEVRARGGVFIADEVQPGFARTGASMWGFDRHGVVPDIVTMGKPMGNGAGLYTGVEVVRDRDTKDPDRSEARRLVNALRERQVLISVCGHDGNVLKIRPPLVFSESDVDWFCSAFTAALSV
jgi:4-aminobutyrate aminotransferase-like enzyme